jgi:hypothetical protein
MRRFAAVICLFANSQRSRVFHDQLFCLTAAVPEN